MELPRLFDVRMNYVRHGLADVTGVLRKQLETFAVPAGIRPGQTVAVTAGSRGITGLPVILKTMVEWLRSKGLEPFVFPAMGSHGGATAAGQVGVLTDLGVTQASVGAPIRSTVETVVVGTSAEGIPVHQDRAAHEADWVVVVNRVKRHTGFTGATGSGLLKMLAIGMGKPAGAQVVHSFGPVLGYEWAIQSAGRKALEVTRVLCGVGLIEDAYGETAEIRVVGAGEFERTDRELLARSLSMTPGLPVEEVDLLIVDRMGKNISGTGMDTHTIGRLRTVGSARPTKPRVRRVFVRELTPESEGNAIGIGLADFTTDRLVARMDYAATVTNCLTSMSPEQAQIPVHYASDRECIKRALAAVGAVATPSLRILRIRDTSHVTALKASEAVVRELTGRQDVEVIGETVWTFDDAGNLV